MPTSRNEDHRFSSSALDELPPLFRRVEVFRVDQQGLFLMADQGRVAHSQKAN